MITLQTIQKFSEVISKIRVSVVGDYMLDQYIIGEVERISPEAPIPIVRVTEELSRLGGAGNVVSNIASLGAQVECFPVLGKDSHAAQLLNLLRNPAIEVYPFQDHSIQTIVKTRVVARKQQLVRIDWDPIKGRGYSKEIKKQVLDALSLCMKKSKALIISDYGKGAISDEFLKAVFQSASEANVLTFVDPKDPNFSIYKGCTAITPNLRETHEATGIKVVDDKTAELAATKVHEITSAKQVYITRAEQGITVLDAERQTIKHLPAIAIEVFDVSGAGDTVISMLAIGQELGLSPFESAQLANIAASTVIKHFGTVPCTQREFLEAARSFLGN